MQAGLIHVSVTSAECLIAGFGRVYTATVPVFDDLFMILLRFLADVGCSRNFGIGKNEFFRRSAAYRLLALNGFSSLSDKPGLV